MYFGINKFGAGALLAPFFVCAVSLKAANEDSSGETAEPADGGSRVATLLDTDTTNEMHDDSTLLRTVSVLEDETGVDIPAILRRFREAAMFPGPGSSSKTRR